jgi:hypothetical protein
VIEQAPQQMRSQGYMNEHVMMQGSPVSLSIHSQAMQKGMMGPKMELMDDSIFDSTVLSLVV